MKRRFTSLCLSTLLACLTCAQTPPRPEPPVRFLMLDLYVDSQAESLAAYQVEVAVERGQARIAGIEGGDVPAFQEPPFYDPKAMQQERVILAAFNAAPADKLPKGRVRVATIHLQTIGAESPQFTVKLQTAGTRGGKKIPARATLEERHPK
jgi:hypothetical protein